MRLTKILKVSEGLKTYVKKEYQVSSTIAVSGICQEIRKEKHVFLLFHLTVLNKNTRLIPMYMNGKFQS